MPVSRLPRWTMILRRLWPRRLDRQVMLLVTLLLCLIMPYFAIHEANESADRVVNSATLQARALTENIAITSLEHVVSYDFTSSEQLLLRSARFPGVQTIQVADRNGKVISSVYAFPGAAPQLRYDLRQLEPPQEPHAQLNRTGGRLTIWEPITGASLVGWVQLRYSLAEAESTAQSYLFDYMLDGAIMTLLLMALILLVMRRPLQALREAATFASGLKNKCGEHIPVITRSLELEQLGRALNEASTNLFEQETTIRRALKALNTQKSAMDEHSIISITDVDGNITYANQKFLDATGYSNEELLGKTHSLIKSGQHSDDFFRQMWLTITAGEVWHGEIHNKAKDGRPLWVNTTIVPFMDESGKPYEFVAIRTDITGQKQVELELEEKALSLKQISDHMEDLVMQRTTELVAANRELQQLNAIKSEFVSVVSHELRTPLTSIKSFAEILIDDVEALDYATQKRFLNIINDESDRLGRLINDLLDLQKIDAGKMTWKNSRLDLAAVLKNSVDFFTPAYRDKGLQLHLHLAQPDCLLDLDEDRMRQLFANLLSNALKFTETGGVTVTMSCEPTAVIVKVSDTGIGIPAAELERVFESFHQVDSSETRKIGGSGLGLAICKEIVEHYQGRIWVESDAGKGSSFYVTLPIGKNRRESIWLKSTARRS